MFEKIKNFFKKESGKMANLDEILKGIDKLSPEEQAKVKAKMEDLYKAEDEREIDKIEEDKAEDTEVKDEKSEEVKDESEEIGKDVDEVEDDFKEDGDKATEEGGNSFEIYKKAINERLERMEKAVDKLSGVAEVEDKAKEVYGIGNGVFSEEGEGTEKAKVSTADVKAILNRIKR